MSTTRKRDRIFAGFGAALFLASACAFTVYVIWQMTSASSSSTDTTKNQTTATACDIGTPVPSQKMPAPEPYKPEGDVTELQTTDIEVGTGAEAKNGDCLVMKYQGNLASDGTVFDENYTKEQALQFTLGKGDVIKGWDQGLVGMKVGGTRRVVIPSELGYGSQSSSSIPANSDLVFTVKLVEIK